MTKTAFSKIAAGLEDAIAYSRGDDAKGRVAAPIDVRAIRERTGKTQAQFARTYHLSTATVRDWEQQRRIPEGPARVLLELIEAEPGTIERLLARA